MTGDGARVRAGAAIERRLGVVTERAQRSAAGATLLGVGLAVGVLAGGLAAFIVVWAVLVGVLY